MDKNTTKRQHYVPRMYLKNFRAMKTDLSVRAKEGMISCYLIKKDKCFNTIEDKICQEKNIYEFDMINAPNYIENRFKENVEDLIAPLIKSTIKKCDNSECKKSILSKQEIELYGKYIIIQFFRSPQFIKFLYHELLRNIEKFEIQSEQQNVIKGLLLYVISDLNSQPLEKTFERVIKSHTFIVLKNSDSNFFTTDNAIFINYIGEIDKTTCTCNNLLEYSDLILPLSPKYCLAALNNIECKESSLNGFLIECNNTVTNQLLQLIPANCNIIIADKITSETISFVKQYFQDNKEKWDNEQKELLDIFEKLYGYRPE